ncbi:hypothetical protein B0H14DRAFT_3778148 [Mycena olivaceomarginata]|nr:hypothetical protein B0H14DRAFT_3778148 [Mycena olivaceomarginata]
MACSSTVLPARARPSWPAGLLHRVTGGRQITSFMRKGADILFKWVGEAERQPRLFKEARTHQPSIIFWLRGPRSHASARGRASEDRDWARLTPALEEAEYEDAGGESGALEREMTMQVMASLRVYRLRHSSFPPCSRMFRRLGPSVAERVRAAHDGADSLLVFVPSTKQHISRYFWPTAAERVHTAHIGADSLPDSYLTQKHLFSLSWYVLATFIFAAVAQSGIPRSSRQVAMQNMAPAGHPTCIFDLLQGHSRLRTTSIPTPEIPQTQHPVAISPLPPGFVPSTKPLIFRCLGPSVAERVRAAHDGADSLLVFIPSTKLVISRTSPRRYSGVSGHPVPNACTLPTSARLPARFVPNPKTLDAIWRTFGRLVAERVRAVHVNPDVPPDRPPDPKTLVSRMLSRGVFVHPLPNACALSTSAPAGRRISPRPKGACTYLGCYLEGVQVFFLTRCRTPPTSRRIGLRPKNTYISDIPERFIRRFGPSVAERVHTAHIGVDSLPNQI